MSYTKYKTTWSDSDLRSAKAFNWIETQYDELKTIIDAHDHDTDYYTKTDADTTFFSVSFYDGFDADMLDGYHFSDLVSEVMPVGCIILWKSYDEDIPSGWAICNGQIVGSYTTPDLRDRFIIGAGGSYNVGDTPGVITYDGTVTPTASLTIGDHPLTSNEIPAHGHDYTEYNNNSTIDSGGVGGTDPTGNYVYSGTTNIEQQESGGDPHGHTGSTISVNTIDPRPSYYSLYYIMKV